MNIESIKNVLWLERYRPKTLQECILPERIKESLKQYVKGGNIINYSAVGLSGSGKTSSAIAICEELNLDYLMINMSNENGIDTVRNKIVNFASTQSMTSDYKVIILDEFDYANCLGENQSVMVGTVDDHQMMKLSSLIDGHEYPIVSLNLDTGRYENDTGRIVSDTISDDVYEVKFRHGANTDDYGYITCTDEHPFICDEGKSVLSIKDGLQVGSKLTRFNNKDGIVVEINKQPKQRVINLEVYQNHTFITDNDVVTHNCNSTQPALRGVIEQFQDNCRFIVTANHKTRIIDAIYSRCPIVDFNFTKDEKKQMIKEFQARIFSILNENEIAYDTREVTKFVISKFPDFRSTLNEIQRNVRNNELFLNELGVTAQDKISELFLFLKNKDFDALRKWVVDNTSSNDGHLIRRAIYKHLPTHINPQDIPRAVLLINEYDFKEAHVIDREVNMVAFLCEFMLNIEIKNV